jgi:hypothetical protein
MKSLLLATAVLLTMSSIAYAEDLPAIGKKAIPPEVVERLTADLNELQADYLEFLEEWNRLSQEEQKRECIDGQKEATQLGIRVICPSVQ